MQTAAEAADQQAFLEIFVGRRTTQQIADRMDRIGAIVDSVNTLAWGAGATLAQIAAAQATPVFYINALGKKFDPIK